MNNVIRIKDGKSCLRNSLCPPIVLPSLLADVPSRLQISVYEISFEWHCKNKKFSEKNSLTGIATYDVLGEVARFERTMHPQE